jgi:hypothetical protein
MRLISLFLILFRLNAFSQNQESSADFQKKLNEMYRRINKSIELIREQIVQNQSAPFLANLYMELGDYLNQKANVMYYLKMEALKGDAGGEEGKEQKFQDVVESTKEAISVYEKVINEFPNFKGKSRAYFSLAVANKSIDDRIGFLRASDSLIKKFPGEKETVKVKVLVGQDQFDNGVFDEALATFLPITKSKYVYERNVSKYKIGLIKLATDKPKEALAYFEEVVLDPELKDEDKEKEISLDSKNLKSGLKREALIDSIRAFTEVFKTNAKPVSYYSRIAPSETLFQEAIEKLAYRYIQKKKYNEAVGLLRTLSERESEPGKVLNIYKEVLLMIPLDQRVYVPVSEIRYVLERYIQFNSYFKIDPKIKKSMKDFFEKQLRDLGTRSHDKAKVSTGKLKRYHLAKAVEFYELYLAIFGKSEFGVKLAMNLGDTYFRKDDFINCGDYYLRVFKREFGETKLRSDVIKNAIYCLQKKGSYSFYELRRVNGLLIEALKLYMKFDPNKAKDPKTNFTLAKAYYDQGFYEKGIGKLIVFMRKFPQTKYAVDSANLILDYYNVKSDFAGIIKASDRILGMKLPNKELNEKVSKIREQAKYKKLQAKVQSSANFDGMAIGKSYLSQAAKIGNSELRNLALKKALDASKQEKDFKTFFKSASFIAAKEKDPNKRYEIEASIANEHTKMTNYSDAKKVYKDILQTSKYSAQNRLEAFNQMVTLSLAMRDWDELGALFRNRSFVQRLSPEYLSQIEEQVAGLLESPAKPPSGIINIIQAYPSSAKIALGIYKSGRRSPGSVRGFGKKIEKSICRSQAASVCRWDLLEKLDRRLKVFKSKVSKAPPKIQAVEALANDFAGLTNEYASLEGGEDAQVDIVSSLAQSDLYKDFSQFLKKVAAKNPPLRTVLGAKANESLASSRSFLKRCRKIIEMSKLITPSNKYCYQGDYPSLSKLSSWSESNSIPRIKNSGMNEHEVIKKNLFSSFKSEDLTEISNQYLKEGNFHYAAAASTYALSLENANTGDLSTILGCSLGRMGLLNEASYYLNKGSSMSGLQKRCLASLKQ